MSRLAKAEQRRGDKGSDYPSVVVLEDDEEEELGRHHEKLAHIGKKRDGPGEAILMVMEIDEREAFISVVCVMWLPLFAATLMVFTYVLPPHTLIVPNTLFSNQKQLHALPRWGVRVVDVSLHVQDSSSTAPRWTTERAVCSNHCHRRR